MPTTPEGSMPGPKRVGRTPKPLLILVHHAYMNWSEVLALQEQGHQVEAGPLDSGVPEFDLILAPNAWRMTEDLRPFLPLAIKAARAARYGPAKETHD